jgi:hypothetical protein
VRYFAQIVALSRAGFGVAMLADPGRIGSAWIGPRGCEQPVQVLTRSLAARDIALGGGALLAVRTGGGSGWFAANALCDAVDLTSAVVSRDALPESGARATVALAGVSLAACVVCAVGLARD